MAKAKPVSTPPPTSALNENELAFLKAKLDRVILLLDASVMPPEVKTAWLTLLPHMTIEQVDRLTELLEEEIALTLKAAKGYPEDEELALKLKAAKERYDDKIAAADKVAFAALKQIEDSLSR